MYRKTTDCDVFVRMVGGGGGGAKYLSVGQITLSLTQLTKPNIRFLSYTVAAPRLIHLLICNGGPTSVGEGAGGGSALEHSTCFSPCPVKRNISVGTSNLEASTLKEKPPSPPPPPGPLP